MMIFEPIAIMVVLIVAIATIGDIFKKKVEQQGTVGQEQLNRIQADLTELKKGIAEIREFITDLYIENHEQKFK